MASENLESDARVSPQLPIDPIESAGKNPPDLKSLVQQVVEAGEWPAPELLDQIVSAGAAAVGPLLDALRARPHTRPDPHVLRNVMGVLSVLRTPEVIPELVRVVQHDDVERSAFAADALGHCGDAGFEALLELCKSESLKGYRRANVIDAAAYAALDKPARKTRLAEILRPFLDHAIARAREELKQVGSLYKHPPREDFIDDDEFDEVDNDDEEFHDDDEAISGSIQDLEDRLDAEALEQLDPSMDDDEEDIDEDMDVETCVAEDVAFFVGALATIADPVAHNTIKTAFREGLVDESMTSKEQVAERYAEAKQWVPDEEVDWNWLDYYRMDYEEHLEETGQSPAPARVPRSKYRYEDRYDEGEPPPDIPATAPIRNAHSKVGRNDPCWCGSGKKFKKCHLGKDGENG
jgi:hypothetical protein